MQFKPVRQISTILRQQYFEPTISWSFRVALALNVPLIVIPFYKGFSYEVIWAAFGAYMLSLIDYRGMQYKKIIIQGITALLVSGTAFLGMRVGVSLYLSVAAMFAVGLCIAVIRNWRDYGPSIAVSAGFFFLLGMATPVSINLSFGYCGYLLAGCSWAILITVFSFPFQPSNPVRRSVAKIWKANTDLLDVMIRRLTLDEKIEARNIIEKELAVRNLINQSRSLFTSRENKKSRVKTLHYDQLIELRKTASLFAATLSAMHEEMEIINARSNPALKEIPFYKTISSLAQASARLAIVIFTFRPDDFSLAKVRVARCEATAEIFSKSAVLLNPADQDTPAVRHFTESLLQALYYLKLSISQIGQKLDFPKSDYLENYRLSYHEFISGLRPRFFIGFFTELFRVNLSQRIYALRVATGLTVGVFIFKFFNLNHGYWIPLTIMIVIQPYYGATLKKGIERMGGTVAGIICGGLVMLLPLPREAFVAVLVVDSFCVAYFLRNNYKVGVFFVTIMMVLLMQISQQVSWQLIGWRILSTLTGAVIALAAGYSFWPRWESKRFPALLANALSQNKNYLLQVIVFFNGKLPVGETWYSSRRLAEGANNDVFVSAQRMLEEPGRAKQRVDRSFALVGTCVRISREITSLGLSMEKNRMTAAAGVPDDFYNEISRVFDCVILLFSRGDETAVTLDFSRVKRSLADPVFQQNDDFRFIRTELEKIVFELEAAVVLKNTDYAG